MSEQIPLFGEDRRSDVTVFRKAITWLDAGSLEVELGAEQLEAVMYGKVLRVPRLEAWWGDRPYRFGGRIVQPRKTWPHDLLSARLAVERITGQSFDSCFVNVYRDGQDTISWHADDAPWIGPWIASASFGAARKFVMRRKADHKDKRSWLLEHGDLILMGPGTQDEWEHSIPRTSTPVGRRVNLTFRQTVQGSRGS